MKKNSVEKFFQSPWWPALLSGLVAPGIGQIVNRQLTKGIFLLITSLGAFFWFSQVLTERLQLVLPGKPEEWEQNQDAFKQAILDLVNQNPGVFLSFQLLIITVWIFGMVDAFVTAKSLRKRTVTHALPHR